ncbi:MAG TPA: RNA 2',3'-cyclic phosphodiesterase [Terriglobales bacterium]|nr:RNA 2',3'-cyclic phosphodiesterase [Terriglobales bacterium]
MRLFVAIDIEDAIRQRLARFMEGVRGFAPEVRWVRPESLHLTLKFLGETDEATAERVRQSLAGIRNRAPQISFGGTGFFPTPRSARVFWIGVEASEPLAELAEKVEQAMEGLGYERERREFAPHLTLARSGSGRPGRGPEDKPNLRFRRLQEKLAAMPPPDFGTMTAREFHLYQSRLSPKGSEYTKLASFKLD